MSCLPGGFTASKCDELCYNNTTAMPFSDLTIHRRGPGQDIHRRRRFSDGMGQVAERAVDPGLVGITVSSATGLPGRRGAEMEDIGPPRHATLKAVFRREHHARRCGKSLETRRGVGRRAPAWRRKEETRASLQSRSGTVPDLTQSEILSASLSIGSPP